jgi:uncharacterized membrane protein (UPF0136 family)
MLAFLVPQCEIATGRSFGARGSCGQKRLCAPSHGRTVYRIVGNSSKKLSKNNSLADKHFFTKASVASLRATLSDAAKLVTLVYAATMAVGGVGAYFRTKSKASIVSGVTAAVLLGIAYSQSSTALALGVAVALTVVFGIRYSKSKKLMPSGVLGGVSAAVAIFLAIAMSGA